MSPKRRVAGVAGAAEHGIHPADLPGKEDAVAVVGEEGIFQLYRRSQNRRCTPMPMVGPVVAVAPGDVVAVVNASTTRAS